MFATIKRKLKWSTTKTVEYSTNQNSLLLAAFIGLVEDVLFWRKMWLSLIFILVLNLFFLVCVYQQIKFFQVFVKFLILILSVDALETWLKYKHRITCLKKLANRDITKIKSTTVHISNWINKRLLDYVYLRERNHTKAFLLLQIIFGVTFFICKHISGYTIVYIFLMLLCISYKLIPSVINVIKKIQQNTESDFELEELIPEQSVENMDLLSIEQEQSHIIDEKLSLDYWKPEDLPIEEVSDSSENSSSLETNLSIEKMQTFEKEIETSDSSEDDYIPKVKLPLKEDYQSTMVFESTSSWANAAYSVFQNIGGAVANVVYASQDDKRRKRVSSIDSLDGFEMIDKNDIM